jgi:hypothetical protein
MATGTLGDSGRRYHTAQTHFLRADVTYAQNSGTVGVLPPGALVIRGGIHVETGFNDTTGDDIDVGVAGGDDDLFHSACDVNSQADTAFDDLAAANSYSATARTVTWNYTTAATGDGSAGLAVIWLEYVPANIA